MIPFGPIGFTPKLMINKLILTILSAVLGLSAYGSTVSPEAQTLAQNELASRAFSLENRYRVPSVNEVMKKNILLNLAYLDGSVQAKGDISWDELVNEPKTYKFSLAPGATFAYHSDILPQYQDSLAQTTNSYFNAAQGYLSDGYLYGDGVCHLASLINWAARDAGLEVLVTKDHRSVAPIPEIPDDYGVSIYINPQTGVGERNNLYITNNKDAEVSFEIEYTGTDLEVKVLEQA